MDTLVFPCFACLIIGFLGGFAFGFRTAALVRTAPQPVQQPAPAADADLVEDFA